MYMEQFYYTLKYLEGDINILADCFSRLPRMNNKITVGEKELEMIKKQKGTIVDFKLLEVPKMTHDEVYINLTTTETSSKDWTYRNKITINNNEEPELFPTILCTNNNFEMIECLSNMPSYISTRK